LAKLNVSGTNGKLKGGSLMKVLFTNNYGMDRIYKSWKKGEHFGHHLWGVSHLHESGIDVDILPYEKYAFLDKISRKLKIGGYLDQQLRILFRLSQYDLIYSGNINTTFLLSYLRCLRIFQKPVVSVVHQCLNPNSSRDRILVKGNDRLLCLSKSIKRHIETNFMCKSDKLELFEWGADLLFYDENKQKKQEYTERESTSIMTAGHADRDYDTLIRAFTEINFPLRIYCNEKAAHTISDLPENVTVYGGNVLGKHALSPQALIRELDKAYAIAIPLKSPNILAGLTSLMDAMAIGKAVVMTKNNHIDIDIEKERIGIWVDYKDVKGWQQAISYLLEHPHETIEMGKKARYLCDSKYNLESCSSRLSRILKGIFTQHHA
jgi:glycosyltransferase involved in cell wall biosynthesis